MVKLFLAGSLRYKKKTTYFLCALLFLPVLLNLSVSEAETLDRRNHGKKIIVLDPGHGGHDEGATGTSGLTEKTVVLNLSKLIVNRLKKKYTVILTRTDDYSLDLYDRTASANNNNADLFISLHANGSYIINKKGTAITYYEKFSKTNSHEDLFSGKSNLDLQGQWEDVQENQITKSRAFAQILNEQIKTIAKTETASIQKAPVYVLSGANMPAVLIEIGYLTNPSEEKKLNNSEYLTNLAHQISLGIELFLK